MATQPPSDPWAAHKFKPLDIRMHLLQRFEGSPLLPFPPRRTPTGTGIYGLYLGDALIYIGKAPGQSDLRQRLWEDARKIGSRTNIKLAQLQCRFLMITEEWVHYAEHHLIDHYKPEWNGSGFGSHIPGAGRPGVKGPPTWDQKYPRK
jgi:hypothetical protein